MAGQGGLGLVNMRERTEKLGGKLTILSAPEQGTTVKVAINNQYTANGHNFNFFWTQMTAIKKIASDKR